MSFRRFLLTAVIALCGALSSLWAQTTPASSTRDYAFPPVGLAGSETASITVVNVATALSSGGTTAPPAPSCSGTISFSNSNGAIGIPASFTVGSEQFATVTLTFASAGLTGDRGEIVGRVALTIPTSTRPPCSLVFSLETYDSTTGATHAVLSNALAITQPILPIAVPEISTRDQK